MPVSVLRRVSLAALCAICAGTPQLEAQRIPPSSLSGITRVDASQAFQKVASFNAYVDGMNFARREARKNITWFWIDVAIVTGGIAYGYPAYEEARKAGKESQSQTIGIGLALVGGWMLGAIPSRLGDYGKYKRLEQENRYQAEALFPGKLRR